MRTLNFICKVLQGTCKFVIYLHILIVHFWELFVKLFCQIGPMGGRPLIG